MEKIVREVVPADELRIVVSNIGLTADFSAIYTPNSGPHTAFVQVGLAPEHKRSSFEYMDLVRTRLQKELPQVSAYFQTGRLVDAVLNLGLPAPIDIQIDAADMDVGPCGGDGHRRPRARTAGGQRRAGPARCRLSGAAG